jgi:3-isopropylmalate dehydrogenase
VTVIEGLGEPASPGSRDALAQRFPRLQIESLTAAAATRRLVHHAAQLDVLVADAQLAALLAEQATALFGAPELTPIAYLGDGPQGVYAPAHGAAAELAGRSAANPIASILSVAMMFRYTFGLEREAQAIERAVEHALLDGCRTAELGGALTTRAMGAAVRSRLDEAAAEPLGSMLTRAF